MPRAAGKVCTCLRGRASEVIGDGSRPLVIAADGRRRWDRTARGVARRLDLAFLDTGAMYRAITWLALHEGLDSADEPAVARLAREAQLDINTDPDSPSVAANGHDVTTAIRDPDVSAAVSAIATNLDVRRELVDRQRELIIALRRASSPKAGTSPRSWL